MRRRWPWRSSCWRPVRPPARSATDAVGRPGPAGRLGLTADFKWSQRPRPSDESTYLTVHNAWYCEAVDVPRRGLGVPRSLGGRRESPSGGQQSAPHGPGCYMTERVYSRRVRLLGAGVRTIVPYGAEYPRRSESPETGVGRDGPSSMPPQPEKPPRSRALLRPVTPARQAHAPTAPRASGVKSSTAGTPPSRPGRKAHN